MTNMDKTIKSNKEAYIKRLQQEHKQLIAKIKYIIEQNKILEKESIKEQDSIKMAYYKGYIGALENVLGDLEQ